jgi:predicted RNase H-like HicB family nuclease
LITFKVELEREDDGRWLAEVVELPGVLAYGKTQEAAPAALCQIRSSPAWSRSPLSG